MLKRILPLTLLGLLVAGSAFAGDRRHSITVDPDGDHDVFFALGKQAKLGVQVMSMTPELREHMGAPNNTGVLVQGVVSDSAAEGAGLKVGDVITSVDDRDVTDVGDLVYLVQEYAGETVEIGIVRKGKRKVLPAHITKIESMFPDLQNHAAILKHRIKDIDTEELEMRLEEMELRMDEQMQRAEENLERVIERLEKRLEELDKK